MQKCSLQYLSLSDDEFEQSKDPITGQSSVTEGLQRIIFFNGNRGKDYLEKQFKKTHKGDLIYLVVQLASLSEAQEDDLNHFLATSAPKIKGVMDAGAGLGFIISEFNGIREICELSCELDADQNYLKDFEKRLEGVSGHLTAQLERVQEIHDLIVPLREFQWKGLKTVSKYASGDSLHSEFWDIVRGMKIVKFLIAFRSAKDSKSLTSVQSSESDFHF